MAEWDSVPTWTPFEEINGGQQFSKQFGAQDLNALAENIAYLYEHMGESEWLGEYVDGLNYQKGAIVSYEGNIYLCIKDLDDQQDPTNTEYWKMLNKLPNLISKTITENGTYKASEDGQDELAGTWVFNDTLNGSIDSILAFTWGNYNCSQMTFDGRYFEVYSPAWEFAHALYDNTWYFSNKTITITSTLAEVANGAELLTWLKSNATKTANTPKVDGYSEVIVNVPSGVVEEWDGSGVVIEEIGTEEPEEPEDDSIVGTWVFNDTVNLPNDSSKYAIQVPYNEGRSYEIVATLYEKDGDVYNLACSAKPNSSDLSFLGYYAFYVYNSNANVIPIGYVQDGSSFSTSVFLTDLEKLVIYDGNYQILGDLKTWLKANATKQGATLKTFNVMSGASTLYACQYEEGMTWQEFVDSEYNPDDSTAANVQGKIFAVGYVTSANNVICWSGGSTNGLYSINLRKYVTADEVIGSDGSSNYEWGNPGDVGGAG